MIRKYKLIIFCLLISNLVAAQVLKPVKKSSIQSTGSLKHLQLDKKINPASANVHEAVQFVPIFDFKGRADLKTQFVADAYNNKGQASFISGKLAPSKRSSNLQQQAQDYIKEAAPLMKISDQDHFKVQNSWTDNLGQQHIKYQQQHKNISIYGAEVILHSADNIINSLNGVYSSTLNLDLDTNPSIQPNEAVALVKDKIKSSYRDLSDKADWFSQKINQWEKELVFFENEDELLLSYHVKVYPNIGEWMTYFIDARTGEIIKEYSNICKFHAGLEVNNSEENTHEKHIHDASCHSKTTPNVNALVDGPSTAVAQDLFGNNVNINTYEVGNGFYMIDGSRSMFSPGSSNLPNDPVGAIWTIDAFDTSPQNNNFDYGHVTSGNNSWNQREAVSAHANAGESFEYFKQIHSRESIDGGGGTILSFVNVADETGSSMGNAFWNGVAIFYGNGDSDFFPLGRGLDVAGHELSHGVVQKTANLEYYGESGAMNESFADIFGAMIDRDDWQIGEDVVKAGAFPSGALRDMQDPHNGAATGNYGGGWQPQHVNEMYTGTQDNAGVHINSGIPNHAYYLAATAIGKDKAERIFYRALQNYLTKSSQFVDLRAAVERATSDLYGTAELNAISTAFANVGIGSGGGGSYENDAEVNPGQDFILYTDPNFDNIYIADPTGMIIADPLSSTGIASKPSVTDDGEEIVFIGKDKKMYIINIDWDALTVQENVLEESVAWRNVIISKDGNRIAALRDQLQSTIWVYDFTVGGSTEFTLYNPTYTEGISTGDVLYADVMEFDISSDIIMYDAANEIRSQTAGTYEYWDIGFLEVWNSAADTWALGNIEKPFPALPEGTSVGNPTFAKNSPYVIAFDFIDEDGNQILGANLERGDVGLIYDNTVLGYPSFSKDDTQVIFDLDSGGYEELGILALNDNKISANPTNNTPWLFQNPTPSQWGVWFSNGVRVLSELENVEAETSQVSIFPNPSSDILNLKISGLDEVRGFEIYDMTGRLIMVNTLTDQQLETEINVSSLPQGSYILGVTTQDKRYNSQFVINR